MYLVQSFEQVRVQWVLFFHQLLIVPFANILLWTTKNLLYIYINSFCLIKIVATNLIFDFKKRDTYHCQNYYSRNCGFTLDIYKILKPFIYSLSTGHFYLNNFRALILKFYYFLHKLLPDQTQTFIQVRTIFNFNIFENYKKLFCTGSVIM